MDEPASEGSLRPAPTSLLGVDVGSAFTKAALFELVEGQYRLIARGQARTTTDSHVYEGLERACADIQALTGRALFAAGEPLAGEVSAGRGVDVLAVALSCHEPLRVLATNAEAAAAARAERCHVEALSGGRLQDRVRRAANGAWDAILGAPSEVAAALVYLGQPIAARLTSNLEQASDAIQPSGTLAATDDPTAPGGTAALNAGQHVDGPARLSGDPGELRTELSKLTVKLALERVPGLADLVAAATEPLTTTPLCIMELARLVAYRFGLRLAIADCGASQTTVAYATPDQAGARLSLYEQPLRDIPATLEQARAMHQTLQTALASCVADGFSADLVVGTGALAHSGRWSDPTLTLLNGIQPAGVVQFALDAGNVVSQIATLASSLPEVTCRIFEQDGLVGLGAAVCPRGALKAGTKALDVRWRIDDQDEEQREVNFGELVRISLSAGHKASLALYPVKQVDVGLNRPGVAATAQIDGGRVGLMIDMRDPSTKSQREPWERSLT